MTQPSASALTPDVPCPDLFSLKGLNALITGGSRGIGAAIAIGLADAGASVCIVQQDVSHTETEDKIKSRGHKAFTIKGNLSRTDEVKSLFDEALRVLGGEIHILVNCGGILKRCPSVDVTEADWDQVLDVNLKSLFLLCQAAGRHMIPRRQGKIINVASLNSFIGGEMVAPYTASKGGVSQLTKALSNEWAQYNIQVNALAPGFIATDINTDLRSSDALYQQRVDRTPAGRWGYPQDLAGPAVFLASPASQFISGETILVDGGVRGR